MLERLTAWTQANLPTREQMEKSRVIRPFAHRVLRSELWRFTRRSVPRGVALGMLVGIVVPVAQILFASLLCLTVRANVPVAALVTFVTNPITTPLIWAFSYEVGSKLLRWDAMIYANPIDSFFQVTDFWTLLGWFTAQGKVLALGLFVVATVSAAVSYLATSFGWRWWIARKRRARLDRARAERAARVVGAAE